MAWILPKFGPRPGCKAVKVKTGLTIFSCISINQTVVVVLKARLGTLDVSGKVVIREKFIIVKPETARSDKLGSSILHPS